MTMARAIAFDDTDLVIDLSEVTFMDAATVAVMVRAEAFLRDRSRSLTFRSPSTHARRVLGVGGLAELVDPGPTDRTQVTRTAGAFASWVEAPTTEGADQRGEGSSPQLCRAADLAGRVTSPRGGASADAHATAAKPTTSVSGRGGFELSASQIGIVTAGPGPSTAHDSAVLATIAAAYDVGAKSGSISLRSHDLLRQLHRSASVLREATARIEKEVRAHPDAATGRDALALLDEVRQIGLFYEGSI